MTPRLPTQFTRAQLAVLLEVSEEAVRGWVQAGCPRERNGRFTLAKVFAWRIARAESERRAARAGGSAMQRKLEADAQFKELQVEQLRGTLIPAEEHEEAVLRIAGGFAAVASGQLSRFERRIVQASTPADARILTQEMHRALMEGAQGLADELEQTPDPEESA